MENKFTLRIEQQTFENITNEKNAEKKKAIISVSSEKFDGPLDALYTMIMKHKLEITEISISDITNQFILFAKQASTMELSGDFVELIARLLFLKSSYLLKKNKEAEELLKLKEEEEEIAKQLLEKLNEYKIYRSAAENLAILTNTAEGSYFRNSPEIITREEFDLSSLNESDLHQAILELSKLENEKIKDTIKNRITDEKLNKIYRERFLRVEDQVEMINRKLEKSQEIQMSAIIRGLNKPSTIATFLAILEMMKGKEIHAVQDDSFKEIHIFKGPEINNNTNEEN